MRQSHGSCGDEARTEAALGRGAIDGAWPAGVQVFQWCESSGPRVPQLRLQGRRWMLTGQTCGRGCKGEAWGRRPYEAAGAGEAVRQDEAAGQAEAVLLMGLPHSIQTTAQKIVDIVAKN